MHKNSSDISVWYAALGVIKTDTIAMVLMLSNFKKPPHIFTYVVSMFAL